MSQSTSKSGLPSFKENPKLPLFKETPLEDINSIVERHHKAFASGKTRSLEFRLDQLRALYWAITDFTPQIQEACKADLDKGSFEAFMTEVGWLKNDILFVEQNLAKWVKDESAQDIEFTHRLAQPRIRKEPLGVALVIGAFNFPFQLSFGPMIGAIAAGCCCVLKPSENAPHSAAVINEIVTHSLDRDCYSVVNGGVKQSQALLKAPLRWDSIFYTGGEAVGKIVAKAAAETLTPVTLELGGRNPAFVTKNADLRLAARRLLWAKCFNAGQVCVGQNWTLVENEVMDRFITEVKAAYDEFYPSGPTSEKIRRSGPRESSDYGRIINERAFDRLVKMLDDSDGEIIIGGETDRAEKYIAPTVVVVKSPEDSLIKAESFGPFFTIMAVSSLKKGIEMANNVHDTPLAVYPFGSPDEVETILAGTRSGGASINDGFFHASIPTLPFGGVGTSGTGSYRGRQSFENFTHRRSITKTPGWFESFLAVRYPPYTPEKIAKFMRMSEMQPGFDRDRRPNLLRPGTWLWYIALGATSLKGILARYAIVLALIATVRSRQHRL